MKYNGYNVFSILKSGTLYGRVSRDVYDFTLGYYNNDYLPTGSGASAFALTYSPVSGGAAGGSGSQLFNGNISYTTLALNKINSGNIAGYTYTYDQLNRLKEMNRQLARMWKKVIINSCFTFFVDIKIQFFYK